MCEPGFEERTVQADDFCVCPLCQALFCLDTLCKLIIIEPI